MTATIRKATINDLQKVQELNLKLFEKEHKEFDPLLKLSWTFGKDGTKYFQDRIINEDGCVLIAFVKNKTVGYLCGGITKAEPYRNVPIMAEIENTLVLKNFRSKGIGRQLFQEFIKWCKTKNVDKVKVEASVGNESAIKFYRKNNFKNYTSILEMSIQPHYSKRK